MSDTADDEHIPQPLETRGPDNLLWVRTRTIFALMLREMSARYGKSPGGYMWAVLEPMGMIIVLSFAFSLVLRSPSLGNSFILFYSAAYIPFIFYSNIQRFAGAAINFSKQLLKYPIVIWLDAVIARVALNALTGLLVAYIIMTGILVLNDTVAVLDFEPMIVAMTLALLLGTGVGLTNCVLFAFFPVWQNAWSIATRPLMLASAVIYIYEDLPPMAQAVLWYNPLAHVTGMMRTGFFPMYEADYLSTIYVLSFALILNAVGLMLMRRHHNEVLNR
ncbi:ABC transporter permease [Roseovarius salinarum]|uniref:ABC transporter permease n=1 Tax=Roseovarius salinarum TaxID=1981892 RepID=UPI000C31EF7C|nr:ABC transporter permease [Roseovarius salinarum]